MVKIYRSKNTSLNRVDVEISSSDNFFAIKNTISSLIGSYYDRADRVHKINIDDKDTLIQKLSKIDSEIIQVDLNIYEIAEIFGNKRKELLKLRTTLDGIDCGIKLINGYNLMPFQHIGVEFLYQCQKAILADKVGLGKTMQAFCAAYKLIQDDKAKKCIISVPATLKKKWKRDIKKFLGLDVVILEGSRDNRKTKFNKWLYTDDKFLIVSSDTLKIDWDNYMDSAMIDSFGVIIDEIQHFKNISTVRNKSLRAMIDNDKCKFRFGLSATYVETGLENLFGSMLIIDDTVFGKSFMSFAEKYIDYNYYTGGISGYKNIEDARDRMKFASIRRHKEQVKDQLRTNLPVINENTLWVELNKDQKEIYNDVLAKVLDKINNLVKADKINMATALTELIYLRQVSISTELIESTISSSVKMDALKDLLPELVEENKVVIFCFFTGFIDQMERELKKIGIKSIAMHGSRKEGLSKNRQDYIDKFQNSKDINVLLTSDICKEGVDLERTNYVINTDILWNPASMVQRMGRIDRLNQIHDNIYVINLWCNSGIEFHMWNVLYERQELANMIMDDGYKESRVKKFSFKDLKSMLKRA